jgi:hypothetical protein
MAGDEGFEPPIMGPEPIALPLGQSPSKQFMYIAYNHYTQIVIKIRLMIHFFIADSNLQQI